MAGFSFEMLLYTLYWEQVGENGSEEEKKAGKQYLGGCLKHLYS